MQLADPLNPYPELFAAVTRHIASYRIDLEETDQKCIAANPGVPFIHITREWGTHLVFLYPADDARWPKEGMLAKYIFGEADRWHILKDSLSTIQYPHERLRAWHYYNPHGAKDSQLQEITKELAITIATKHRESVERAWRTERHNAQHPHHQCPTPAAA